MVETLDITIDMRPKGKPRKMESQNIEKIGCVPNKLFFYKNI